ncbi:MULTISPECIES: TetR family transcriptional regulator [unclassified Nocardioides]|uniref:TetR family transcriptional regulator n=1 Tax=unclassified Nocardioides TaxID=2615069 RepID=UPI0009EFEDFD|nr:MULTISPECIES: TetR family transcriptional regulator [unclassified Nocardioides]GAW48197.1 TetR family transcriptional regulator [Nocardioides sp. PD653-B2]GAW53453.1 TetR family transcriptional regulator [Nocardioides sp. PD653]
MSTTNSLAVEDLGSAAQRDRRKRILDATITLASQGGFDAVQMRAVAEQADVALGTLYRYFPSKIHLLVSALQREFERTETALRDRPIEGDTTAERVITVLKRTTRGMQSDPQLTEALTRAFMFADASVAAEIHQVGMLLTSMLTRVMHPEGHTELTEEDVAIARVIGDVWLSALVGWVTGRSTAAETGQQIEVAVKLLLRD